MTDKKKTINRIYALLEDYFGDLRWWPADSDFEVIVGAVLTQNTAWCNVEKAIKNLKREKVLTPAKIAEMNAARLSRLIRSSGYHRLKAQRLKEISRFIVRECKGKLFRLKSKDITTLREKLLAVKGIGPETADSILIYALEKPVFVVDAYTKRIFSRHALIAEGASYDEVQSLVHGSFPKKRRALNQYHALLVETGKRFCKKSTPLCKECPLAVLL